MANLVSYMGSPNSKAGNKMFSEKETSEPRTFMEEFKKKRKIRKIVRLTSEKLPKIYLSNQLNGWMEQWDSSKI